MKKCFVFDNDATLTKTNMFYFISEFNTFRQNNTSLINRYGNSIIELQEKINNKIWNKKRLEVIEDFLSTSEINMFVDIIFGGYERVNKMKEYFEYLVKNNVDIHISSRGYYGHIKWALKLVGLFKYVKHVNSASGNLIMDGLQKTYFSQNHSCLNNITLDDDHKNIVIKDMSFTDPSTKMTVIVSDYDYQKHMFFQEYIFGKYSNVYYVDDVTTYHNIISDNIPLNDSKYDKYTKILKKCFTHKKPIKNQLFEYTFDDNTTYTFWSLPEENGGINFGDNTRYPSETKNIFQVLPIN